MKVIQTKGQESPPPTIVASIESILKNNKLCSIATATTDGKPHINTAFFVYDSQWNMYIMSNPATQHSINLSKDQCCSVAIADSHQLPNSSGLVGVQLFGSAEQLSGAAAARAFALYAKRFAWVMPWAKTYRNMEKITRSRFYKFAPTSARILDEPTFGEDNYVDANISA
jgi:uncharacterized protein YhbP (UPF0306 family)